MGGVDAMGNSAGKEATVQESVAGDTGRPAPREAATSRPPAANVSSPFLLLLLPPLWLRPPG